MDEKFRLKVGLAEMLKGGVIMDVVNAEQAKIAEAAGAAAVMALERVPADIRAQGADVHGDIGGAARDGPPAGVIQGHDRDGGFGRNPLDAPVQVAVEHEVAHDQQPPAGERGENRLRIDHSFLRCRRA